MQQDQWITTPPSPPRWQCAAAPPAAAACPLPAAGRRPRATLRLSHQSSSSSPSIHHRVTPVTMCQFSFCQFSSFRNSALTECTPTAATPAEAPTPSECLMRQDWIMLLHAWSISSSDPTIITRSMGIASSVLVGVWPLGGISHTFAAGAFTFSLFES